MEVKLFVMAEIYARLLVEFATRQDNSYVSVVSSEGDNRAKRFASFLSRKIPTRLITQLDMDKQRLSKSQVQQNDTQEIHAV